MPIYLCVKCIKRQDRPEHDIFLKKDILSSEDCKSYVGV